MTQQWPVIPLSNTSKESLGVIITSRLDPTAQPPEFNLTAYSETSPGVTWTPGTWDGTWDSETAKILALTPIIGETPFVLTEGEMHKLWVRWSFGGETPDDVAAVIRGT